jgi:hypothetical protein
MSGRLKIIVSSSYLSQKAAGKQREMSIVTPTITIFLPRSLRQKLKRNPTWTSMIGWHFPGGPTDDKLFVVVAGIVSPQMAKTRLKDAAQITEETTGSACIVGECRFKSSESHSGKSSIPQVERGEVWMRVGLSDGQTRGSERNILPEIHSIRGPIICSPTAQCAIIVVLYTIPKANRMRYLSLEPMLLPAASSAGVLDRSSSEEVCEETRNLKRRLQELIKLDVLRFEDLSKDYPKGRAPGAAFRNAIMMVSKA